MNGSFSLCDLADLSDLEVELTIEERDISKVAPGQKCKVRTEAYPDRIYEGIVLRSMPIADRNKAAIPVRVKVTVPREEEGIYLKPDMTAMVSLLEGLFDAGKGAERDQKPLVREAPPPSKSAEYAIRLAPRALAAPARPRPQPLPSCSYCPS